MQYEYLNKAIMPGEHDFAIIDRGRYPSVCESWPVLELVSPMLQPQAHLYPWLLPLKDMRSNDWNMLIRELGQAISPAASPASRLLLRSDKPIPEVRSQLIRALYFTDENHQGHILRWYDPRVLFHLFWMFSAEQLMTLLPVGLASCWTLWLEGKWYSLVTRPLPGTTVMPEYVLRTMRMRLQNISLINGVLADRPSVSNIIERLQTSRQIETLLIQAREFGLEQRSDLMAFASSVLEHGDKFWQAPDVQEILRLSVSTPGYFSRWVNSLRYRE